MGFTSCVTEFFQCRTNIAYNCHLQSQSYILCAFFLKKKVVAQVGGICAPTGHLVYFFFLSKRAILDLPCPSVTP